MLFSLNCWLFGFLASWLFGFLASWLLGFLASRLLCFSVYAASFGGFSVLVFRILCIPSSSSAGGVLAFAAFRWFMRLWLFASSAFPVPLRAFWLVHPLLVFGLASRIISVTSSSLYESS